MRRRERQQALIALVDRQGDLTLEEACRNFSVSPATMRRDFSEIAGRGLAKKTWGGLQRLAISAALADEHMVPSKLRETLHAAQKERIARAACALIRDNDVLTIDGGTTTLQLAPHLANRPVRILTNSLLIAYSIHRLRTARDGAEVYLTGGLVYPGSGLLVGPQVVDNLTSHHATWAFISVSGMDASGATNTNQLVVESERTMIRMARRAVVLADSSKWGHRDMVRVCDWSEVAMLITDAPPPPEIAATLDQKLEMRIAP